MMKQQLYYDEYQSLLGDIQMVGYQQKNDLVLTQLSFPKQRQEVSDNLELTLNRDLFKSLKAQLDLYFSQKLSKFDIQLDPQGTSFQKDVWRSLLNIDYGKTCSYQDIASAINKPNACRAVGAANGKNPISIIIPCHRVIGKNNKLVGYAGGVEMKQKLLAMENHSNFIRF